MGTESGWAVAAGSARAAAAAAAAAPARRRAARAARSTHASSREGGQLVGAGGWPGQPEKGGSEVTVRFTLDAATGVARASIERTA